MMFTQAGTTNPSQSAGRFALVGPGSWSKQYLLLLAATVILAAVGHGQTVKLKLSTILPGTEKVQLVSNGDFQFQGPASPTNTHPAPLGWTAQADMFADAGTNTPQSSGGVVARAHTTSGAPVCKFQRTLTLAPATDYLLSAYLWNMGDAANHVTTVIDFNDAMGEPQMTLAYSDAGADQGYFVYRAFNTTNTGTTVTLRLFYDNPVGAFTAAKYSPVAAQWDNIAVTKTADFAPPVSSGNLRPLVCITSPSDGSTFLSSNSASLAVTASASDYDGTISKVEFFADGTRFGSVTNLPYESPWSNMGSGAHILTAVATDNSGAATISAPVSIVVVGPPAVPRPALRIIRAGTNSTLSWPNTLTWLSLQSASNLLSPDWQIEAQNPTVVGDEFTVTIPGSESERFFKLGTAMDTSTLSRKMLMGYQGWFACPGDGSTMNRWVHWFSNQTPIATNATVDFWPDISELEPDELYSTGMTMSNGSPAKVYSPWNRKTVLRHFKWMKEYHLDGVFLQRFTSELSSQSNFGWRNQITSNVMAGAETYGRVFAIMYDISGQNPATIVSTLTNDWIYLAGTMHVTNSPYYIRHKGKPVVVIWGFGFTSRTNTPADAQATIGFFKTAGCTVMGGVPTYWRTLDHDAQSDPAWAAAYRAFDILSPWSVTRFSDLAGADSFKNSVIVPDLAETKKYGIDYMPVLFPGFSWHNLKKEFPLNQIPRNGGTFYWRQVYNAVAAGSTMLYGAMFDEMNEGTSMFKMAATPAQLPVEGTFVPLNADGQSLPSDWYLRLAEQASRMLRGEIPLQTTIPISP